MNVELVLCCELKEKDSNAKRDVVVCREIHNDYVYNVMCTQQTVNVIPRPLHACTHGTIKHVHILYLHHSKSVQSEEYRIMMVIITIIVLSNNINPGLDVWLCH